MRTFLSAGTAGESGERHNDSCYGDDSDDGKRRAIDCERIGGVGGLVRCPDSETAKTLELIATPSAVP